VVTTPAWLPAVVARDPSVFVHELALCESDQISPRTRVWAFAHMLPGARIGAGAATDDAGGWQPTAWSATPTTG
jgi:hypothetical protein